MFEAVIRLFGFGNKPPQAESPPATTAWSDNEPENLASETLKNTQNITLPIQGVAHPAYLDRSSDEYEDETYAFVADVKDSKNKKLSIMAFYNPSSPENHISRAFATDLGFPIPEPPNTPSIKVSWSSSSLLRLEETTRFTITTSESFKLLFGREGKIPRHGASIKQNHKGKGRIKHHRSISFREAVENGLLYPLELADSDSLESGSESRGPRVVDVEARLQPNHSHMPLSLERYIQQPDHLDPSKLGLTTNPKTLISQSIISETSQADRTHELNSENWENDQRYISPRKPILSTGLTTTTATKASATPSANPYAVLMSLDSDSSNITSSKKQKKKRKSLKKPNRLTPSDFGEHKYFNQSEVKISKSESRDEERFEENLEVKPPPKTLKQSMERIAQEIGGAGHEATEQSLQIQERIKERTSSKKRLTSR